MSSGRKFSVNTLQRLIVKGSNMIVCVLSVSNSRWCCFAAPGDLEGAAPVAKMRVPVFAGGWACEIELRQTGVICFPWRQRSWSYGVFKCWISDAHFTFQWKWQVLHNYDISVLQRVGMFFDGIACLTKVWPLFKREFPRVPMTWRSARARISNVTSQM